jgi:hypothetical protein
MAKARKRLLKVYQAQFGFYDTVVAAPSQAAALRAWGVRQNLFAEGQATITNDAQAVEAGLAHPETPLRRAVGSHEPFLLEPTSFPKVPDAPKKVRPDAKSRPEPTKPRPDRSQLDAAENAFRELDEGRKREEANFRRRQEDLEAETADAQSAYVANRKSATAALAVARRAYREAGGAD